MDSPDFIVIVGRDKATVNPQTYSATNWLRKNMLTTGDICVVDREGCEDIIKLLEGSHWTVEVK